MLLVIGLDGATWDLIDPWIAAGELPNLARLRERGCHGPLRSTMPPATMPSWTSFATGCNPGRHGVFDFTRRQLGSYEVRFVNATFRKQPSVWRMLSDAGQRVAVVGVPGTYPPEVLNGCMVSGFDTPVTTRADESFVQPASFAPLLKQCGGFPFADFQEFRVGPQWYAKARSCLLRGVETKTRLAKALLERGPWDCFVIVFGESDTAAHHFWQFHDPQSPRFDADGASKLGDTLLAVYRQLDAAIGELEARARPEAMMLLSDHGFGGSSDTVLHLNGCLAALGFQRREPGTRSWASTAKHLALTTIPSSWQAKAFRLGGGRWASRLESRSRFAGIDWARTRAFSEDLNYSPNVWLNLRGRDPEGTVERADYERVRDDLIAALEAVTDPDNGERIVRRAWRREEVYEGSCLQEAPDVVLELNLIGDYSYVGLPTSSAIDDRYVRQLRPFELGGGKIAGMGGSHRLEGMFVLAGLTGSNEGPKGWRAGVRIEDMGATVLSCCGVETPPHLDGRQIWREQSPVPSMKPLDRQSLLPETPYSPAEEAELEERLGALGYL